MSERGGRALAVAVVVFTSNNLLFLFIICNLYFRKDGVFVLLLVDYIY